MEAKNGLRLTLASRNIILNLNLWLLTLLSQTPFMQVLGVAYIKALTGALIGLNTNVNWGNSILTLLSLTPVTIIRFMLEPWSVSSKAQMAVLIGHTSAKA